MLHSKMRNDRQLRLAYRGGLKRLDKTYYEGISYVHWTMSLKDQATGWLDGKHHLQLREICTHALAREFLCCPAYCLMPDHGHFLVVGYDVRSDQRLAIRWLRREWNHLLAPHALQHQPYDSVLREKDRARDAFADTAAYILRNPERAGLVEDWRDWAFSGAIFPGYPHLDPRREYFWEDFWKAHRKHLNG
jgi:REP element-mobilizing transposase RayT